ncbi:MAG TPA: protease pro-enzyme activation domain-containing protein, partial [Candidatus Acidoferrales bacterium]|nr:protease pro-enzyme activation domain-containing protein [Candidatus Acidoferrales bacterium]
MIGRFWLLLWLLQIPAGLLCAAEKRLPVGQVLPVVARGNVSPIGDVAGANELRLALALPLRDPAGLANLLAALCSPGSPLYHHYLRPGEFADRFGPSPSDYAALGRFAASHQLTVAATHRNRLVLDVSGRVADVERAFQVKLHWYRHPSEPRNFFAPDTAPTVDARLPLLQVSGLDDFYLRHPNVVLTPGQVPAGLAPNGGSSPMGTYMGNDFHQAYLPGATLTGAGQNVDLVEFDAYRPQDITDYVAAIGLTNDPPQVTVEPVAGGVASPGAGIGEVTLDIDMVLAMSPGVSNIFVYEAPNPSPWVDILSQIADDDLAAQVSCSWSGGGPDPAAEQIFQQMDAQGQSVFNATGDTGAYTIVVPYPCASPYVTEVGGTYLDTDTNGNYVAESVWNRGGGVASSGGVGLGVRMPVWQMGVDMATNGGSMVWRNIPDVALAAEDIYVIVDNQGGTAAGTSCAAPLWAGLTALINQQAAQLDQPPVGFLNPAIYALCRGTNYAAVLHDITLGNNTNLASQTDYWATPGYDLCTGWGTPAGTNLINALTTPDPLGVLPQTNLDASGLVGGPFSGSNWVVTLTNRGAGGLDWSLGNGLPAWLWVSAAQGALGAHGSTNLTVNLANAGILPTGSYIGVLSFTNLELSRVQNVFAWLDIGLTIPQNIVQNGGFETGDFSDWTLVGDTITVRSVCNIVATDADYPGLVHSGTYGAFLGQSGYPATLSQALTTTPGQNYLVSFWLDNLVAGDYQQFSAFW